MQVGILMDDDIQNSNQEFILIDNDHDDKKNINRKRKFDCLDTFKSSTELIKNTNIEQEELNGKKLFLLPWVFIGEKRLRPINIDNKPVDNKLEENNGNYLFSFDLNLIQCNVCYSDLSKEVYQC